MADIEMMIDGFSGVSMICNRVQQLLAIIWITRAGGERIINLLQIERNSFKCGAIRLLVRAAQLQVLVQTLQTARCWNNMTKKAATCCHLHQFKVLRWCSSNEIACSMVTSRRCHTHSPVVRITRYAYSPSRVGRGGGMRSSMSMNASCSFSSGSACNSSIHGAWPPVTISNIRHPRE